MKLDPKGCSHGKAWDTPCQECDKVWFEEVSLPMIKRNCQHAAKYYLHNPSHVSPEHTADLFHIVAHLITVIEGKSNRSGWGSKNG